MKLNRGKGKSYVELEMELAEPHTLTSSKKFQNRWNVFIFKQWQDLFFLIAGALEDGFGVLRISVVCSVFSSHGC